MPGVWVVRGGQRRGGLRLRGRGQARCRHLESGPRFGGPAGADVEAPAGFRERGARLEPSRAPGEAADDHAAGEVVEQEVQGAAGVLLRWQFAPQPGAPADDSPASEQAAEPRGGGVGLQAGDPFLAHRQGHEGGREDFEVTRCGCARISAATAYLDRSVRAEGSAQVEACCASHGTGHPIRRPGDGAGSRVRSPAHVTHRRARRSR